MYWSNSWYVCELNTTFFSSCGNHLINYLGRVIPKRVNFFNMELRTFLRFICRKFTTKKRVILGFVWEIEIRTHRSYIFFGKNMWSFEFEQKKITFIKVCGWGGGGGSKILVHTYLSLCYIDCMLNLSFFFTNVTLPGLWIFCENISIKQLFLTYKNSVTLHLQIEHHDKRFSL